MVPFCLFFGLVFGERGGENEGHRDFGRRGEVWPVGRVRHHGKTLLAGW